MNSNYQEQYKNRPVGFRNTETGRLARIVRQEERRRDQRAENYAKHRDVSEAAHTEEPMLRPSNTERRLKRWKEEREIKKKIETRKKKPVFKVGIVHHKFYSPPVSIKTNIQPAPCHPRGTQKVKQHSTPLKRITRATQRRLEAKQAGASNTPVALSTVRPKKNQTKSVRKRLPSITKVAALSFAPKDYSFKGPAGLSEIPLFGRFAIPNRPEDEELSGENVVGPDGKEDDEKPWPRASNPPVDIMDRQRTRSLARQNAIELFSRDSTDAPSRANSSIEAITLRLSSEDESSGDADEVNAVYDPDEDVEKIDEPEDHQVTGKINVPEDNEEVEKIDDLEDEVVEPDAEELERIAKVVDVENSTPPRSGTPVPASFSPYIVSSRGKDSARKEQQIRMGIRRSAASEIPMKDTVMQNLNISVEEEEQTAQYFKFISQREVDRLTELCNTWEVIMEEPELTEDARYQINQAIGQTNLLIRKKFERFRRLVLDCETGKGEMLVQCKDLQGFWDMMYMEVKDCESRFLKLEFLRSKGWIEEQIVATVNKATRKKVAAPTSKPKINAKSAARSWILAARKKKQAQKNEQDTEEIVIATKNADSEKIKSAEPLKQMNENSSRDNRQSSMSEGFDLRQSAPKPTPRKTPTSLLRKVQLSQASKTIRSPLAIMKISKMCRTPEIELDDTISYVNSDQTPGKGILKKSDDSSSQESCPPKSSRKVDFNDEVFLEEVVVENDVSEELRNSLDLGRSLAKIDSYDEDDDSSDVDRGFMEHVTLRKIEKRLDFEDDSFDESENTDIGESAAIIAAIPKSPEIPVISIVPNTPTALKTAHSSRRSSSRRSSSRILETSIAKEQSEESEVNVRVLRSRTVANVTPSKSNRRSVRSIGGIGTDNSFHDSSTKENSDPHGGSKKAADLEATNSTGENSTNDDKTKRRRSTRKSVRFNADDDCTACAPKPTLPMTPHSRRSRKISLLGESSREFVAPTPNGDLMSFNSPAKLPARIRKSSGK